DARVFLFYGNQTSRSILFREAIEDLKDRYLARFALHNVLSRERQEVGALSGHIDDKKVSAFLTHVIPASDIDHVLLCGPAPFIAGVNEALGALGVPKDKIILERFTTPKGRPPVDRPQSVEAEISVTLDGVSRTIPLSAGETILEAGRRAGLDVPYSCQAGMCCTCRAKVVSGRAEMSVNYALRPDEVAEGFILTCQAIPTSEGVTVDYDAA
ncbi:MAG: 2Fe-2S iron-sulfur cluster-binding protein, partial [Pseudomonadota bacterium]